VDDQCTAGSLTVEWLGNDSGLIETVMEPQLQEPLTGSERSHGVRVNNRKRRGEFGNSRKRFLRVVANEKSYLGAERSGRMSMELRSIK